MEKAHTTSISGVTAGYRGPVLLAFLIVIDTNAYMNVLKALTFKSLALEAVPLAPQT